jgi:hypothetical protein
MNLIQNPEQFEISNIFFSEPINNLNNQFIKITYSNSIMSLNGIAILVQFKESIIETHFFKFKCKFNTILNKYIIQFMIDLETKLLNNINIQKEPQYKLRDQLSNGFINFADNLNNQKIFNLRIYGIWFNEKHCGLTYKFFQQ